MHACNTQRLTTLRGGMQSCHGLLLALFLEHWRALTPQPHLAMFWVGY